MDMDYFKEEIERTLRVLEKDRGELQNETDIEGLYKDRHINEQEYTELKRYNRKLCR